MPPAAIVIFVRRCIRRYVIDSSRLQVTESIMGLLKGLELKLTSLSDFVEAAVTECEEFQALNDTALDVINAEQHLAVVLAALVRLGACRKERVKELIKVNQDKAIDEFGVDEAEACACFNKFTVEFNGLTP